MNTSQPRRSRRSASQWESLVEESETTSLPLATFCERANVSLSQFYQWRRKLRAGKAAVSGGFTPVRLRTVAQSPAAAPAGHIEVRLQNGRVVRVVGAVDAHTLRQVILTAEGGALC